MKKKSQFIRIKKKEKKKKKQTVRLVVVEGDVNVIETTASARMYLEFLDDHEELAVEVDVALPFVDRVDGEAGGIAHNTIHKTSTNCKRVGNVDLVVAALSCQQIHHCALLFSSLG